MKLDTLRPLVTLLLCYGTTALGPCGFKILYVGPSNYVSHNIYVIYNAHYNIVFFLILIPIHANHMQ